MSQQLRRILFFISFLLPLLIWPFCQVDATTSFQFVVPKFFEFELFESPFYYWYVHLFSFVPVFFLSFDKKVGFYKSWKKLFPAIILVGLGFIVWDALFTKWNVWGFNEVYLTGLEIFGLPLEEVLFFVTIPFASLFVHACMVAYFPRDVLKKWDALISIVLGSTFLLLGFLNFDQIYTSTTCLTTGSALIAHFLLFENRYRTFFYRSFLVVLVPFILVDGALTGWFSNEPVVLYNPEEFLGWRIGSVPLEDGIYGMLLLLLIVTFQDWFSVPKASKI